MHTGGLTITKTYFKKKSIWIWPFVVHVWISAVSLKQIHVNDIHRHVFRSSVQMQSDSVHHAFHFLIPMDPPAHLSLICVTSKRRSQVILPDCYFWSWYHLFIWWFSQTLKSRCTTIKTQYAKRTTVKLNKNKLKCK